MSVPTGYQPPPKAKVWNVILPKAPGGSVRLALDVFRIDTAINPIVTFGLLQQRSDGQWDYVGALPPADPTVGPAGKIWELGIGEDITYQPPGGARMTGAFSDICAHEREGMILKWIDYIRALIQRVFFDGAPVPSPTPSGDPWATQDWTAQITNLQNAVFDRIEIVNGYPVAK